MAKILYVYNDQVYANITNKCDCACTFCIRSQMDGVGDAETLWHTQEPTLEEILAAIDAFDFTGYKEFVFCGYGEPTCALENLIASARYVKEKTGLPIRLNSNGLGNLYHKRDIVPDLKGKIEASDFVQHKESENKNKKLTAKPVIKLPPSDALHLTQDKEEKLSAIIAEINSKLGKNYDNDVAVKAVLQIRDILMKSDDLKRAAQNNTEKDFEFSFNDHLDEALIEGYEQNKDFFSLLLENDEAKKQVMGIFVDGIYKSLREAK